MPSSSSFFDTVRFPISIYFYRENDLSPRPHLLHYNFFKTPYRMKFMQNDTSAYKGGETTETCVGQKSNRPGKC
jgi:hypothetical protein